MGGHKAVFAAQTPVVQQTAPGENVPPTQFDEFAPL